MGTADKIYIGIQIQKNEDKGVYTLTSTSSTSTLRKTMLVNSELSFSNSGEIIRQGPHQVAEKSTMTCNWGEMWGKG